MRLSALKIGTRLVLAFGVVLVMCVVTAALALFNLAAIQGNLEEVVLDNDVKSRLSFQLADASHVVSRVMRTVALLDDKAAREREMAKLTQAREAFAKATEDLSKMPATAAGKAMRARIAEANQTVRGLNNRFLELVAAEKRDDAITLLLAEAGPAMGRLQEAIDQNIELQAKENANLYEASRADYARARWQLVVANLLAVATALVAGVLVTRSITRQLGGEPAVAAELARSVAQGDLVSFRLADR